MPEEEERIPRWAYRWAMERHPEFAEADAIFESMLAGRPLSQGEIDMEGSAFLQARPHLSALHLEVRREARALASAVYEAGWLYNRETDTLMPMPGNTAPVPPALLVFVEERARRRGLE